MTVPYLDLQINQQHLLECLIDEPGHHLISGPPGSGKSLLAVHQAAFLDLAGHPTVLLAHSNLLRQHLQADAAALESSVPIMTFHSWMHQWYREATGTSLGARIGAFDWTSLISVAVQNAVREERTLVIDEGQDLPLQFYHLCRIIGARVIVFADEFQRITETQCTLAEIAAGLGNCTRHEISENMRNSYPIASLAREFYVGKRPPPLPKLDGPLPTLLHRPESRRSFVRWLTDYAVANRGVSIGVVVRRTHEQQALLAEIERMSPGLRPQIYVGNAKGERHRTVDPYHPGLRIVNRASVKGLGFDTVIIPDAHTDAGDPTAVDVRMLYYVLTTRARWELVLCYCGDREPPILEGISPRLLERQLLSGDR